MVGEGGWGGARGGLVVMVRTPALTLRRYDYDAIAEWLSNKQTDPSTNQPLSVDQLCPNRTVRSNAHPNSAPSPSLLP